MRELLARVRSGDDEGDCDCIPTFEGDRLHVDADACSGAGELASRSACRTTVVEALTDRDADAVLTSAGGRERTYEGRAAALLVAAGRFAERVAFHDEALAVLARRDPLRAAHEATGRAGPVSEIAARTALAECSAGIADYEEVLAPRVGPTIARSRVATRPPAGATLRDERTLETDATVRIYASASDELRQYHLEPVESSFDADSYRTLADAHDLLAGGGVSGGRRAPGRAVRRVADDDDPAETLADVLRKHTRGYGVLEDFFADPAVSDVFATAPVAENPLRVTVDGESMRTNVTLTADGARALASRFRRSSGRAFSRANPTLDAVADGDGLERIRVAGVTDPVSDGVAFAFRAHDADAWTLPGLVENGTLSPDAAALLSLAVERDAAGLVAGTRGAGKTTLLGALLWELPAATRTVVLEDTPELPVRALQRANRDVQPLRTATGDGPALDAADALRTALRLGEGALVVGEVRGEEAGVLYEAMRVGASGSAVLGTIHGDGAAAVRERVVTDLGVAPAAFGTTDLVVTLEPHETPDGRARRVKSIEEVVGRGEEVTFEPLYELAEDVLAPTGRIGRGTSHLVDALARADETYADVRAVLDARESLMDTLAEQGRTTSSAVVAAHADRRGGRPC